MVAELAEDLLAVHGQTDQLRLSRPAEQRRALDRYAGPDAPGAARRATAPPTRAGAQLAADLERRRTQARELAQTADVLRHGLEEIAAVAPAARRGRGSSTPRPTRLGDADALRAAADEARLALVGDVTGDLGGGDDVPQDATAALATGRAGAGRLRRPRRSSCSPRTSPTPSPWSSDVGVAAGRLRGRPGRRPRPGWPRCSTAGPRSPRWCASYADAGTRAWPGCWPGPQDAEDRLSELDVSDEALDGARPPTRDAARAEVDDAGRAGLGRAARAAAEGFAAEVGRELAGLAMKTRPGLLLHRQPTPTTPGPEGIDEVALLLAAHPGAPARPVHKGASGGELSRVMLAIEVVFAGADPVPVMVFDEVDAGVGRAGRRARSAAAWPGWPREHQVVVVTHLAQVAAFADTHLVVDKSPDAGAGVTATDIRAVAGEDRVRELARMLSGLADSDTGQAHARELLAGRRPTRRRPVTGPRGGSWQVAGQAELQERRGPRSPLARQLGSAAGRPGARPARASQHPVAGQLQQRRVQPQHRVRGQPRLELAGRGPRLLGDQLGQGVGELAEDLPLAHLQGPAARG